MERATFENLQVCQLAEKLADKAWTAVRNWDLLAKSTLGRQIVRAADNIGANIAEGTGRGSFQDNRRSARTERGLLNETRHELRRAHSRKLLTSEQVQRIKPLPDELAPRRSAYLKSIGASERPAATGD
jgi:four helix bundle protein